MTGFDSFLGLPLFFCPRYFLGIGIYFFENIPIFWIEIQFIGQRKEGIF
jgi:hypothetical protein